MRAGRAGQGHHMLASLNLISATMPSFKGVYFNHPAVHRAAGVFGACCKATRKLNYTHVHTVRDTENLTFSAEFRGCSARTAADSRADRRR